MPAPRVHDRTWDELVAQTTRLLERYSAWRSAPDSRDPGHALVRVFSRLAEQVVDRINAAPEKNFLAFLELIGTSLRVPQPARVPLRFVLATGSPGDARVPARTQVAATPVEGETEPVVFETERELVVTRSELVAAFTRDPARDAYAQHTVGGGAAGAGGPFEPFTGTRPIPHRLHLGADRLGDAVAPTTVRLRFTGGDPVWLAAVDWSYWDGTELRALSATLGEPEPGGQRDVVLEAVPPVPLDALAGRTSAWLCATLSTALPGGALMPSEADPSRVELRQRHLRPSAAFAGPRRLDLAAPFHPFGWAAQAEELYVEGAAAFAKPGAQAVLSFDVDAAQPARPTDDLVVVWEYAEPTGWRELGRSTPQHESAGQKAFGFADTTRTLTRDGLVSFRCPEGWTAGEVNGLRGFWLRARVLAGRYGSPSRPAAPVGQRLGLSYTWGLPTIDQVLLAKTADRDDLLPDGVLVNQVAVDFSRDFLPFGPRPAVGDAWYVASDEVWSRAGATVTMTVAVTIEPDAGDDEDADTRTPPAARAQGVHLRWEYWSRSGSRWALLGETAADEEPGGSEGAVQDGTKGLVRSGQVRFVVPDDVGESDVGGTVRRWLRVRLYAGHYGTDAHYELVPQEEQTDRQAALSGYRFIPADFRPPSVRSLTLAYAYETALQPLDGVLADNDFRIEDHSDAAASPERSFLPYRPTADLRPALYLGFQRPDADTGFGNRTTDLYLGVTDVPYDRVTRAAPPREPAAVVWEYWTGGRWARLGARDETRGVSRRGFVTFIGPTDFRRSTELAQAAFWLRARWDRGDFRVAPRVSLVTTNTMWATHTLSVVRDVLGSSNGEPGQVFQTTKAPVLPGERLEVREPDLPSQGDRPVIEAEEGSDAVTLLPRPGVASPQVWVRWHNVADFHASGPRSRHYVLDRLTGEVRFGDGRRGMPPPRGGANIRVAEYRTGGGAQGNRGAGTITELKTSVPYIDGVTNPEPARGGSDAEEPAELRRRGPATLRNRGRAVTIADYEDLAFEASPAVARVKAVPARSAANAGSVGLVLLPHSTDAQPTPSLELLDRVEGHVRVRMPPTVDLWVAGPEWVAVSVIVDVVPLRLEEAADVQAAVVAGLDRFLHPLTGGPDGAGWDFGRRPHRSDLVALVEGIDGVDHVRRLAVAEHTVPHSDTFLIYATDHHVTTTGPGTR